MAKNAEPARPSVEAILTDIHNTLVEGFELLIDHLKEIKQNVQDVEFAILGEEKLSDKEAPPVPAEGTKRKSAKARPETTLHVDGKGAKDRAAIEKELAGDSTVISREAAEAVRAEVEKVDKAKKAATKGAEIPAGAPSPERTAAIQAEVKKHQEVTEELLRAKISEFAEKFSMTEALNLNEQFGGSRKLSQMQPVVYERVYLEMDARLKARSEIHQISALDPDAPPEEPTAPEVTVKDIQKAGGAFVAKYGDPAFRELLAKFVAKGEDAKISKVNPAKYAPLFEALSNA